MSARYIMEAHRFGGYVVYDSDKPRSANIAFRSNDWASATFKCRDLNQADNAERERLMVCNYVSGGLGEI